MMISSLQVCYLIFCHQIILSNTIYMYDNKLIRYNDILFESPHVNISLNLSKGIE